MEDHVWSSNANPYPSTCVTDTHTCMWWKYSALSFAFHKNKTSFTDSGVCFCSYETLKYNILICKCIQQHSANNNNNNNNQFQLVPENKHQQQLPNTAEPKVGNIESEAAAEVRNKPAPMQAGFQTLQSVLVKRSAPARIPYTARLTVELKRGSNTKSPVCRCTRFRSTHVSRFMPFPTPQRVI